MLCSKTPHANPCQEPLKILNIQIPQLENKFETISHLVGHKTDRILRKRRGLFNGVSYAFNWLFGTPDAADAEFYSKSIKDLFKQKHDIQALMRQQIHIISDAIYNYNSSALLLKANEEKLNLNFIKFNNFSESTNSRLQLIEQNQLISNRLNLLTQMVTEISEEMNIQIESLLFARQNIIHPSIINPVNLRKELLKIKLENNLDFPIPINDIDKIYHYFSICRLGVIYDQEIIIYAIKIPLVHKQLFNLYNLIPLPFPIPLFILTLTQPTLTCSLVQLRSITVALTIYHLARKLRMKTFYARDLKFTLQPKEQFAKQRY
ncbi:hypothetical protein HHI36_018106 [Cryptolaemus montrouzieri]|uniref:Envelope protein n=1 Tax=Cryptolaemus montrouzieri TaxID=559131 RepID=A0ABD2NZ97_9CUCU